MLIKLMKQDFRATGRIMLPLYLAALGLAVMSRIAIAVQGSSMDNRFLNVFMGLISALTYIAVIVLVVATFVLMIWRFYKNYMTDEGYLMFTLPVRTSELIFSKLFVAIGWYLCTAVVVTLMLLITSAGDGGANISFTGFDSISGLDRAQLVKLVLVAALAIFITGVSGALMLYCSMGVGQSFRKRKTLMAVVFYFVFSFAQRIVNSVFMTQSIISMQDQFFSADSTSAFYLPIMHTLWGTILASLLWGVFYYLITHIMLSKRLNLQ